jgi:hypothetical protein
MLIDVHAHFYTRESTRSDWHEMNEHRLTIGRQLGITAHVASILGTWGRRSPTYFPSPEDVRHANDAMLSLSRAHPGQVFGYCVVNPNDVAGALSEIERAAAAGLVGLKLAASRRADDGLLDPIADAAAAQNWPILHHVWQHRRRDWPGQEASDGPELAALAERHPDVRFILAHLAGGGEWRHTLRAIGDAPNIWLDLSGSGADMDMVHALLDAVPTSRLLWGTDLTIDTAVARLRYIEALGLSDGDLERIRWRNAEALFAGVRADGDH